MGETNIPDPTIPLKQSMIAAILPMPLSSCKFSFDAAFSFFSIFSVLPLCSQSETDLIKSVPLWNSHLGSNEEKFLKITKFSCRFCIFWHTDLINCKNRLTIVLKGAFNVISQVEFDILRLNQRKEFICLQSLRHKGCVQRPISCLLIINLKFSSLSTVFLCHKYHFHKKCFLHFALWNKINRIQGQISSNITQKLPHRFLKLINLWPIDSFWILFCRGHLNNIL